MKIAVFCFFILQNKAFFGSPLINLIGHTTSKTGLKVYAMEDRNSYPTKRKISDAEMEAINIVKNDTLGKWNYYIKAMET